MYRHRRQISRCLGEGRRAGAGGGEDKGARRNFWGMEMSPILVVAMLCWCVYTSKLIKVHTLNMGSLLQIVPQ